MRVKFVLSAFCAITLVTLAATRAADFQSALPDDVQRPWVGAEYWANPLQDWQLSGGRIECITSGGDRNVHVLTHDLAPGRGAFEISVRLGALDPAATGSLDAGVVGFKVGARGRWNDFRDSAVRGQGLIAGITTAGQLFIGEPLETTTKLNGDLLAEMTLVLRGESDGRGHRLVLKAHTPDGRELAAIERSDINADDLEGNIALICHQGQLNPDGSLHQRRGGNVRFWFRDWRITGDRVVHHPLRTFGPIFFAQHTLSRGVMKMTAQMPPLGDDDTGEVHLWTRSRSGQWQRIATAPIDRRACTATFRMSNWNDTRDTPYRLSCLIKVGDDAPREYTYEGTIRKNPVDKPEIVAAAFTGNNDFGFPHAEITKHVEHFDPDILFFTGDQIYEPVGGYGIDLRSVKWQSLDYLRKWYLYGWAHREMFRDRPVVCLPDDHDVYHGNIWGAGGRKTDGGGAAGQDSGGYKYDPEWVNAVQRTQTSHHPDPYDPTPIEQGIGVYYGDLQYGGVSFAIIEDRKWKSAPKVLLPEAQIVNGWAQNPEWDAATQSDVEGAVLLGDRQLAFLEEWAADWSDDVWMKAVVSQTIFANVATLPMEASSDAVTPRLRIMAPGEYAAKEKPVADHDSNGWRQTPRDHALRIMRKAQAVHIAGDQHLGSTIQYGVDAFRDAAFAICVPSVANFWPRRWFPEEAGGNRWPDAPRYAGDYRDGFGNLMTVHAVSNPHAVDVEPRDLYSRAPGYGIIAFDRESRNITFANWPRWVDPSKPGAKPYPNWPVTAHQQDNDGRAVVGYLPMIRATGDARPVVQVIDEATGEVVYTTRMLEKTLRPRVFAEGTYTLRIGESDDWRTYRGLKPGQAMELGYEPRRRRR